MRIVEQDALVRALAVRPARARPCCRYCARLAPRLDEFTRTCGRREFCGEGHRDGGPCRMSAKCEEREIGERHQRPAIQEAAAIAVKRCCLESAGDCHRHSCGRRTARHDPRRIVTFPCFIAGKAAAERIHRYATCLDWRLARLSGRRHNPKPAATLRLEHAPVKRFVTISGQSASIGNKIWRLAMAALQENRRIEQSAERIAPAELGMRRWSASGSIGSASGGLPLRSAIDPIRFPRLLPRMFIVQVRASLRSSTIRWSARRTSKPTAQASRARMSAISMVPGYGASLHDFYSFVVAGREPVAARGVMSFRQGIPPLRVGLSALADEQGRVCRIIGAAHYES